MGNLWDSFVSGYDNAGPAPEGGGSAWGTLIGEPSSPESADSPTQAESPWGRLIGRKTHEAGDGFYGNSGSRKVDEAYIIQGLTERGLPPHVAEGFAMNMADESGLDAGINERNPLVEGSRGGYGLYQLTGPRRKQYEEFARERGTDFSDPDAQLDFLVWELENTEKGAANAIFNTSNSGDAGAAIVNKFLRPAEEHRHARVSKYLGRDANSAPPRPNRLWLDF